MRFRFGRETRSIGLNVNKPTRSIEVVAWGGLVCVLLAVLGSFLISNLNLRFLTGRVSLPVLSNLTAFSLTNEQGRVVTLDELRGQVWIADIIFTRCPGPCMTMTREMRSLQDDLAPDTGVRFLSLTADPGYDTSAVLKQYGEKYGASPARWSFLTGTKTDLYRLATRGLLLAVEEVPSNARESDSDLFVHSTRFALVDRQGQVRGSFDAATPESRTKIRAAVRELLRERR